MAGAIRRELLGPSRSKFEVHPVSTGHRR
jgi:hypothetical protein